MGKLFPMLKGGGHCGFFLISLRIIPSALKSEKLGNVPWYNRKIFERGCIHGF